MDFSNFITEPFIDLSSKMLSNIAKPQSETRVSQLLLGERVSIIKNHPDHLFIKAFAQPFHCKKYLQWQAYSGWISNKNSIIKNDDYMPNYRIVSHEAVLHPYNILLPFGSLVEANKKGSIQLPDKKIGTCNPIHLRFIQNIPFCVDTLILDAMKFLNIPYLWGGRFFNKIQKTGGVDCSGFIHLIHGAQGFHLPRDAKDQFLACKPISSFNQLPIGGCLFTIKKTEAAEYINHVMLKDSLNTITDSSFLDGGVIRRCKGKDFEINNNTINFHNDLKPSQSFKVLFGIPLLTTRHTFI
ncbi:Uncharacterized protein CLAVI_000474 [Candidatus Clavichlamydia salmonicola]|uniref:C40 family peptidase n=1 Tax=Candidatus Clavichlamydia salmonicola TaxID=469812 RepID=UPI001890FB7E|nr:NlpC/P60 family protein [Candidatus Clavichlamydia salmonicola]MBF5050852.1 Uncharacterized protein [Candidatus Clavichlamydia salmonicola]